MKLQPRSIQQAESNPLSPADIDEKKAEIDSLQQALPRIEERRVSLVSARKPPCCCQEVTKLKEDRLAEEESLKAAKAQRTKEHGSFVKEACSPVRALKVRSHGPCL